jgi:hypothetical protein
VSDKVEREAVPLRAVLQPQPLPQRRPVRGGPEQSHLQVSRIYGRALYDRRERVSASESVSQWGHLRQLARRIPLHLFRYMQYNGPHSLHSSLRGGGGGGEGSRREMRRGQLHESAEFCAPICTSLGFFFCVQFQQKAQLFVVPYRTYRIFLALLYHNPFHILLDVFLIFLFHCSTQLTVLDPDLF